MNDSETDYLQPTIFWLDSLKDNWAHLNEEFDEAMELVIPAMRTLGQNLDNYKEEAAMELADVQVMCNTIIRRLEYPTVMEAGQYNFCQPNIYRAETYAVQLIRFTEMKVRAGIKYREIARGNTTDGDELYYALKYLIIGAEALMSWLIPEQKDRTEIRRLVYEKNFKRGYYTYE